MSDGLSKDTTLSHYRIVSRIGVGGMGDVYLAEDALLDRHVALKVLRANVANDGERVRRFIQEAKAASALNHPNILTVYEIGEYENTRFIATELVKGHTLRRRLCDESGISLRQALEIAIQVAAALAATHDAGIIHRDIKPENIMIRDDGLVKVLDFGLVKLSDSRDGPETDLVTQFKTAPGLVIGTPAYMSPEQARGLPTDARTDIWSLGVVIYEMLTAYPPFTGETPSDTMAAILVIEPPPPGGDYPTELLRIVKRTLEKKADERYQTVKDLLLDLKNLKRELEFTQELERSHIPGFAKSANVSARQTEVLPLPHSAVTQEELPKGATHHMSSAEYIVNSVRSHKFAALGTVAVLLAIIGTFTYFLYARKPILTDKDTILLTEFENKTGEEVFDSTLKQGLTVQLQQSPFLDIFSDARVLAALKLMGKPPDEKVTRALAREICQRQGLKAFIVGSIVKFDRNYSITLEALNGQTGDRLAIVQSEAEGKDNVLKTLSTTASELRGKLGESLASIQKFDAPLEVTTTSLDALKDYALGIKEQTNGNYPKAIEYFRNAAHKDPNFAQAWLGMAVQYNNTRQPGLAAEHAAKAYALRDRVSEYEQLRITFFYYSYATGEIDKAVETQEDYVNKYPRDALGPGNLGNRYAMIGQIEKAAAAARSAVRLNPNSVNWHATLTSYLIRLNRYAEAKEELQQVSAQKLDSTDIHQHLYSLAFIEGDTQAMQEQIVWSKGQKEEYRAADWQAETSAFAGQWQASQDFSRRSTDMTLNKEPKQPETAAAFMASQAVRAAWLGEVKDADTLAEAALKIDRNKPSLANAALAFAIAGEAAKAQPIISELEQQFAKDTLVNQLWLPEAKAALELRKGNAQAALEMLESTRRFEPNDEFRPQALRALAYLKLNKGAEAAGEYRKILEHRGEGPRSLLWPLAHLGLGRALAMQGDKPRAKQSYDEFFRLWVNADANIPVLLEVKKEYAMLE